jgi:RNA polymerase sigma-70 factor (ECF subfamily)
MIPFDRQRHDQFLRLFIEHEEALRGFVRALMPTREDALEVLQEVAAVLWRKFDKLATPEDFRRWAFGVARFEAMAFRRDRARDQHVFSADMLTLLADDAETAADGLKARREAMDRCLAKLPAPHRALVDAAYARGARIDALAASMGRTAMSLYKALHRIRTILAACVERTLEREGLA